MPNPKEVDLPRKRDLKFPVVIFSYKYTKGVLCGRRGQLCVSLKNGDSCVGFVEY